MNVGKKDLHDQRMGTYWVQGRSLSRLEMGTATAGQVGLDMEASYHEAYRGLLGDDAGIKNPNYRAPKKNLVPFFSFSSHFYRLKKVNSFFN
jgi:hypothetical protein